MKRNIEIPEGLIWGNQIFNVIGIEMGGVKLKCVLPKNLGIAKVL
jgi:hypothetical protein